MFNRRDRERIARNVTASEKQVLSSKSRALSRPQTNQASVMVKTPTGGIPARSGTTLGSATCTIQTIDRSTGQVTSGDTITVFNSGSSNIEGGAYPTATRIRDGSFVTSKTDGQKAQASFQVTGNRLGPSASTSGFATTDASVFSSFGGTIQVSAGAMLLVDGIYSFWPNYTDTHLIDSTLRYCWSREIGKVLTVYYPSLGGGTKNVHIPNRIIDMSDPGASGSDAFVFRLPIHRTFEVDANTNILPQIHFGGNLGIGFGDDVMNTEDFQFNCELIEI